MEMKVKRDLTLRTLLLMKNMDVQNTEGDFDTVKANVTQWVFGHRDSLNHDFYPCERVEDAVKSIINPLWDFYFDNLHDGYNVTVR